MKKIVLPGIIAAIASFIATMLVGYVFQAIFPSIKSEYENTAIFRPWNDPLMNIFWVYPFIFGITLAWVWDKVKGLFTGTLINKALCFGFVYWVICSVPGMIMSLSSFKITIVMTISWTISGFLQAFAAALVFGKMNK